YLGRIYIGRDGDGKQIFEHVGRFAKKKERDDAVVKAKAARATSSLNEIPLCGEYVDRYLADYGRRNRESSLEIAEQRLRRFRSDFADRRMDIPRAELKDWMNGEGVWAHRPLVPKGYRPTIVTLYNHAIDEDDVPLERNPARKLGWRDRSK